MKKIKGPNYKPIRTAQIKEMFYVFFYLWYVLEWLVRLFMKGNARLNIAFEREAYGNQENMGYLEKRKRFGWIDYLKRNKKDEDDNGNTEGLVITPSHLEFKDTNSLVVFVMTDPKDLDWVATIES